MKNCFNCGSKFETKHGTYRFEPPENVPGGTIVIPDATWQECDNCGQQSLPADLCDRMDRVTLQRQGLLLPEQIKAIREKHGLTQVEMAERLNVGEKTYARWESGRSIQNKSSDTLIRLMDRVPEEFSVIKAQRNPERKELVAEYCQNLDKHKGCNAFALAAHDADLEAADAERLRAALRKAVEEQQPE